MHSSEYFGKDKDLNRSAASRAVYKENPGSGKEAVYFSVPTRKIFVVFARVCEEEFRIIGGIKGIQGVYACASEERGFVRKGDIC